MLWPAVNGPEVTRVFTSETSAEAAAVPPLPVLSVLFAGFGSDSAAVAAAVLSKAPAALLVALPLILVVAPQAQVAVAQGRAAQPPPVTFVMVMFVGESVTWMLVAVDFSAFATTTE